jgi:hypothetical protein
MNANDVIESYVTDVAVQLPRKQRNDVAFELRALLQRRIAGTRRKTGPRADAAMATDAARTWPSGGRRRALSPDADDHRSRRRACVPARATLIGLAVIWGRGCIAPAAAGAGSGAFSRAPSANGGGTTVILRSVAGHAGRGFRRRRRGSRRRWPQTASNGNRARAIAFPAAARRWCSASSASCAGCSCCSSRAWLLDVFWGGRAAPAAYDALTYTDTFLIARRRGCSRCSLLNVPMFLTVIVQGRWSARMRRIETAAGPGHCAR